MPCAEQTFTKIAKTQIIIYLYLINCETYPFILGMVITDGSFQVSKQLYGLINARDFEQSKHIEIIIFAICWRLSALKSPSHEKSIFFLIYTIISNKLWDSSLYFGHRYNRWVLASQQTALGPCKFARFRAKQTYKNYSFRYLLTFVSVKESFSRKKAFS